MTTAMGKPYILHIFTPEKNVSPFDVNMAQDAGWEVTMPYLQVTEEEVRDLVQDAIFSRSPKGVKRTGIFIGGRDAFLAGKMLKEAKAAMVPPFEVSVLADPSGAYTTAAAMVAKTAYGLQKSFNLQLSGCKILILGGTGPVGQVAAYLAAKEGASVTIMGRRKEKSERVAEQVQTTFGEGRLQIGGAGYDALEELLPTADVIFATGAAGVQLLDEAGLKQATALKISADVNAVPPPGIYGVEPQMDLRPITASPSGALGLGALAIGNLKYATHSSLLRRMRKSETPLYLHFEAAFETACRILEGETDA